MESFLSPCSKKTFFPFLLFFFFLSPFLIVSADPTIVIPPDNVRSVTYFVPTAGSVTFQCVYSSPDAVQAVRLDRKGGPDDGTWAKFIVADNTTTISSDLADVVSLHPAYPSPMVVTFTNVTDRHFGDYQCTVIDAGFTQVGR